MAPLKLVLKNVAPSNSRSPVSVVILRIVPIDIGRTQPSSLRPRRPTDQNDKTGTRASDHGSTTLLYRRARPS